MNYEIAAKLEKAHRANVHPDDRDAFDGDKATYRGNVDVDNMTMESPEYDALFNSLYAKIIDKFKTEILPDLFRDLRSRIRHELFDPPPETMCYGAAPSLTKRFYLGGSSGR